MIGMPSCLASVAVHPHTRGDNITPLLLMSIPLGSPPHTWGQCRDRGSTRLNVRFTPTHVGTIGNASYKSAFVAVHPHTRGDNKLLSRIIANLGGSPPHTWGQCIELLPVLDKLGSPPHTWGQ